jgi:type 1 fimbria pilin
MSNGFGGPGSTTGAQSIPINLSCNAGVNIMASLSGNQNAETSTASVLALTGAGTAGVASGVGIQLLYNDTPLVLNQNITLKTSSGGVEFPDGSFTARYYQTKSVLTSGDANATATLNLTYQ